VQQDPEAQIEKEILNWFSGGVELEPAAIHFIESTFGAPFPEALTELQTVEDGEKEVLLDLLFSPDQALCCRVENHLGPEGLSPGQRSRLAARFSREPPPARIRSGGRSLTISMPGDLVDGFLDRLYLNRPLAAGLFNEVSDRCAGAAALQLRSRLRQAGLAGTVEEKQAMVCLISAKSPENDDFWPLLETLLGFLEAAAPGRDLFTTLVDRKQVCLRHLRQAADRSRALERHNIETILIGGDRMPHVDTDALAAEVVRIDDLGRMLFGKPVPAPAAGLPLDLGEVSDPEDLDRLMRFFTGAEKG